MSNQPRNDGPDHHADEDVDASTEEADRANGEPGATHATGEAQAAENRENDPPA